MTDVGEEQADGRVRVLALGPVVVAKCLAEREEIIGQALGDDHRRRLDAVIDVVRGVMGGHLLPHHVGDIDIERLAGVHHDLPAVDVPERIEVGAVFAAEGITGCSETVGDRGLHDSEGGVTVGAEVRVVPGVVVGPAVRRERVGEVGRGNDRGGDRDLHVLAFRALPGAEGAVRVHDPVLQCRQRHRLGAAVGGTDGADLLRQDQVLVGQQAGEVLGVTNFEPGVHQVDEALVADPGRVVVQGGDRIHLAAGELEAALGHREGGEAQVGESLEVTVEAFLAAAKAVEVHGQRVGTVAELRGIREGEVDVDRDAVVTRDRVGDRLIHAGSGVCVPARTRTEGPAIGLGLGRAVDLSAEDRGRRCGLGLLDGYEHEECCERYNELTHLVPGSPYFSWCRSLRLP